ncbi:uncharacterized protein LOC120079303 [Benincasa hispida]|uniref:uncharacterized protein LOC120079303 n=1 Tax=Benincasa hispida TaxID=102211 RepID=UPI001902A9CE|nr:uncharacterized protein LOC120079303 [Benincasa hispida]
MLISSYTSTSSYMKFLKDISKKRKISDFESVALTQKCNALISINIPEKQRDPGSFTVPHSIGGIDVRHVLCDLGASINLMPLSIFKTIENGEATPTSVTLQLADRSITYPEENIKDVLIKVENFIFFIDFIILDYEADRDVSIILGCPFLATEKLLIDVHKGELTMRVDDQEIKFNLLNALKFLDNAESYQFIESFNYLGKRRTRKWTKDVRSMR